MSVEIIDDFSSEKPTIHARKSFRYFLIGLLFLILFIGIRPATNQKIAILIDLCLLGLLINGILALVNSYRSFYYKEKSLKKYIGCIGSIILLYLPFYIIG